MTGADALAAVLIQLADHEDRINSARDTWAPVSSLAGQLDAAEQRMEAITEILGHHATAITSIDGIDRRTAAIAAQLGELAAGSDDGSHGYRPLLAPRWRRLAGEDREAVIARLRAWVEQIYQPSYGHLAAALPTCWERHPLCLCTLDWLSELWSALYVGPERNASTLAAQAEWQTRLLPAAVGQMTDEAGNCRHGDPSSRTQPSMRQRPRS